MIGDTLRTIGQFDEKGFKLGFGVEYKKDRYLTIANYRNGKLDGHGITIEIDDSTIYDGMITADSYTGSAVRLMKNKEIRIGNFIKGNLDGEGKTIYPDGRSVSGTYDKGNLSNIKELILYGGKKINTNPKDINTVINFLLKEWENNFINIKSEELSGNMPDDYKCLYNFPGSKSRIFTDRKDMNGKPHNEFSAAIKKDPDFLVIKKEYNILCKQLTASSITSLAAGKPLKLIPKINKMTSGEAFEGVAGFFSVPAYPDKKYDPLIRVMVRSLYDGYELTADIISKWE